GKIILVAGVNKLAKDVTDGIWRARNIACSANSRRLGAKNPCGIAGYCNDCNTPERSCRVLVIMERQPSRSDVTVVLVNEDLGYCPDCPDRPVGTAAGGAAKSPLAAVSFGGAARRKEGPRQGYSPPRPEDTKRHRRAETGIADVLIGPDGQLHPYAWANQEIGGPSVGQSGDWRSQCGFPTRGG
ncbi:MAG: LUD domain-containing protein, partial [Chloroflexota bacterium]|nr:LUD domain-containing protein [Chloroflexota bacterium]